MRQISMTFLLTAFVLTGCATAYQPQGFTGGFSETQLREDVFQITFRGNGHTSAERAGDFALLRAAEITTANGFKYFVIVDSQKDSSLSTYTTPQTSYTTANAYAYGNSAYGTARTTTYGGQTYMISKPRATHTIRCFKDKPADDALFFEATFVAKSIRTKYDLDP